MLWEDSTNDISHYLGMLDPWYERNVLGLMHLPPEVLCQVSGSWSQSQRLLAAITQLHLEGSVWVWGILLEASLKDLVLRSRTEPKPTGDRAEVPAETGQDSQKGPEDFRF